MEHFMRSKPRESAARALKRITALQGTDGDLVALVFEGDTMRFFRASWEYFSNQGTSSSSNIAPILLRARHDLVADDRRAQRTVQVADVGCSIEVVRWHDASAQDPKDAPWSG
jgi:hypothetical protein